MRSPLTPARVHALRTGPYTDGHNARLYRMSRSAIRLARIGTTHPDHETPPDRRPRMPGRRGPLAVLVPVPAPSVDIGRLIAGMRLPTSPADSGATP
jgi:hypothetical protein